MNIKNITKKILGRSSKKQIVVTGIVLILVIGVIAIFVSLRNSNGEVEENTIVTKNVELFELNDFNTVSGSHVIASGKIRASQQADLVAETSGVVRNVHVSIGDFVERGKVLVSMASSDAAAQVAQAQANLEAQLARLTEMQRSAGDGEDGSNLDLIRSQQDVLVENAYRSLISTDLQAFTENDKSSDRSNIGTAPTVTGTYNSTIEGEYRIELYNSGTISGSSFHFSGLERGVQSVNTEFPVQLGTRGLYIQFPSNFEPVTTWVVPVPNKRSSGYLGRLNAYESALRARDVALSQARTSTDQINLQKAQIASARSSLMAAQSQLEKSFIRAPFSGRVLSVNPQVGEFLSAGAPAVSLLGSSGKEVVVYLNSSDAANLTVGTSALINEIHRGTLIRKAPGIDPQTGKVEAVVSLSVDNSGLIVGEFANVTILISATSVGGNVMVPLRSVRMTSAGSEVFTVEDGILVPHKVTTGSLQGDMVDIISGLEGLNSIVASVRGLKAGDSVNIREI